MYIDGREFKNALGEKMRHPKIKKNTKVRRLERNHCEYNKDYAGFATEPIRNVQKITMVEKHAKTMNS